MDTAVREPRKTLIVKPGEGRIYGMGRMRARFLADDETCGHYSISEWWLEPRTPGPGVHQHDDDHIFYVVAGALSLFVDGAWTILERGGCALIPGDTPHDFQNRGLEECGFLSINTPGGFEHALPGIVGWFKDNPLKELDHP